MAALLIGYARCSADQQDLTAQRDGLTALGVSPARIYVDHGLTGTPETGPACGRRWRPAEKATPWWASASSDRPAT
jgi:DNA invertase Pin-like site-specific DNA recombinase